MNLTARDRSETDDSRSTDGRSPTVVGVAGPSGAGKTTLVERLVDAFAAEGRRVATVKSIHHAIEPDDPGTDTHRHRTAGAAATVGITPGHTFEVSPHDGESSGEDDAAGVAAATDDADARKRAALRDAVARFAAADYDLVVVEGFGEVPIPTVLRGDADPETVAGEVIAEGSDSFDAVREAVRAAEPTESLGRADPAEPNATDTQHR